MTHAEQLAALQHTSAVSAKNKGCQGFEDKRRTTH